MPDPTFQMRGGGDPVAHFEALVGRFTHPSEEALATAGEIIVQDIRQRTLEGRSIDGGSFASYSPAYAKRKGQENVDLYSHYQQPHMLDLLQAKVVNNEIEVGIFNNERVAERARVNNEGGIVRTMAGRVKGKFTSLRARREAIKLGSRPTAIIPARPWLGPSPEALNKAASVIISDIVGGK